MKILFRALMVMHFMLMLFEHENFGTWMLWEIANGMMIALDYWILTIIERQE